ncbi:MAG: SDR family oxidoreductase [Kiloniellales bacterium]|nr:SDR family oxidoreductase [Kiloniellales bacterium]
MAVSLQGKVGIVTGATSGIGLAGAEAMSGAGMKLVLAGRRAEILQEHTRRLPDCIAVPGEMTDPGYAESLFQAALSQFGALDVVFNNAGLIHTGPIEEVEVDALCEMVRVNVEAAYRIAYLAMKQFRSAGAGHLVNTSSVLGSKVRKFAGGYAGTKYAVEALSEALRLEVAGSAIKVTCLEPGLVVTDLHRGYSVRPEVTQNVEQPLRPADVAELLIFALTRPDHVALPRLMILPQSQEI